MALISSLYCKSLRDYDGQSRPAANDALAASHSDHLFPKSHRLFGEPKCSSPRAIIAERGHYFHAVCAFRKIDAN